MGLLGKLFGGRRVGAQELAAVCATWIRKSVSSAIQEQGRGDGDFGKVRADVFEREIWGMRLLALDYALFQRIGQGRLKNEVMDRIMADLKSGTEWTSETVPDVMFFNSALVEYGMAMQAANSDKEMALKVGLVFARRCQAPSEVAIAAAIEFANYSSRLVESWKGFEFVV